MNDLKTLYHKLEKKVSSLSERLEESSLILNHIAEAILFITLEETLSQCNPAMESLLQIDANEALGTPFSDHFDDDLFGFSIREALTSGSQQRVLLNLNDLEVEASTTFIPKRGLIILCSDRTEIYQLEQSVQRNDRLKELGEMAATLAHEIRNPLGGIEGFASLLQREVAEDAQRAMVSSIIDGTRTLNRLVTNMLDYTRPLRLHFASVNLKQLCAEVIALAGGHCILEGETEFAMVDAGRLKLALLNIVLNGLAVSPVVKIVVKKEKIIEIRDEGPGIAPSHIDKIFTPFFTTKEKGNGLGLCEAQKVIAAHGGTIEVDSTPNEGTTFRIRL